MHRFSAFWHMRLPHRLQGQKVKSQSHGAGACCGGHLAAQLVDFTEDQQLMSEHLHTMIYHNGISAEGDLTNEDGE